MSRGCLCRAHLGLAAAIVLSRSRRPIIFRQKPAALASTSPTRQSCIIGFALKRHDSIAQGAAQPWGFGWHRKQALKGGNPSGRHASLRKWSRTLFLVLVHNQPRKASPDVSLRKSPIVRATARNTSCTMSRASSAPEKSCNRDEYTHDVKTDKHQPDVHHDGNAVRVSIQRFVTLFVGD